MSDSNPALREQFDTPAQQREAARLGLWVFIASEVMFFGALFVAYVIYRHAYPQAFAAASRHTNVLFGTLNTAILLTSSFAMARAIWAAEQGRTRMITRNLVLTIVLALAFLGVKALEYREDFQQHLVPGPHFSLHSSAGEELFFYFYWAMTGLHALHVLIGIGLLSVMAWMAHRGKFTPVYHTPLETTGLYWHFVDVVWIYLYPILYLIGRHS